MDTKSAQGTWVILVCFAIALLLHSLPLPDTLALGRPQWVALILIYWVMALPHRVGVLSGWAMGLLIDVQQGALLGLNALTLALVAYCTLLMYKRLRMYTAMQQSLVVFVLIGLAQILQHWLQSWVGIVTTSLIYLLPSLVSAMLWPWLFLLLREIRQRFQVR